MFGNKQELVKQVNWALRAREPIGFKAALPLTTHSSLLPTHKVKNIQLTTLDEHLDAKEVSINQPNNNHNGTQKEN